MNIGCLEPLQPSGKHKRYIPDTQRMAERQKKS